MIVVSSKGFLSMAGHGHTDHAVPSYYLPEMGSLSSLPCANDQAPVVVIPTHLSSLMP